MKHSSFRKFCTHFNGFSFAFNVIVGNPVLAFISLCCMIVMAYEKE